MTAAAPRAAILLATFNGARFLGAQLASLREQTERDWCLFWRDDGSTDETPQMMRAFAAELGEGRSVEVQLPGRLGASGSFLALLSAASALGVPVAFADQDDIWLPEKLGWALEALASKPGPALYCSRQMLVDDDLRPLTLSAPIQHPPSFPASLAQNIATGCTTVLDAQAATLVAASHPPPSTMHDWWSYLIVTAAEGSVIADQRPTMLYRQHGANLVGAPATIGRRARAAVRRGPSAFMRIMRDHIDALLVAPSLLSPRSVCVLQRLQRALAHKGPARLRALAEPGLRRQTLLETLLFRLWFLIG